MLRMLWLFISFLQNCDIQKSISSYTKILDIFSLILFEVSELIEQKKSKTYIQVNQKIHVVKMLVKKMNLFKQKNTKWIHSKFVTILPTFQVINIFLKGRNICWVIFVIFLKQLDNITERSDGLDRNKWKSKGKGLVNTVGGVEYPSSFLPSISWPVLPSVTCHCHVTETASRVWCLISVDFVQSLFQTFQLLSITPVMISNGTSNS